MRTDWGRMRDLSRWASKSAQRGVEGRGGEEGVLGGAREGGRSEEGVEGEEECEVRGVR